MYCHGGTSGAIDQYSIVAELSRGRRRRHSSRSKSRSDVSDTDGEKTPNTETSKEFNFDVDQAIKSEPKSIENSGINEK